MEHDGIKENFAKIPPKVFISYAWSSAIHERWVLDLATQLRERGVDAILDKWDLNLGNDSIPFMEQMVNDETIKKVIMICDRTYMEKANRRKGGVGIETQIISKKVYEKSDQNKFVAVIKEKDANGNPCVPTYCSSRFYVDLSEESNFTDGFTKLLYWIFDKPTNKKPPIGEPPLFNENEIISLGTSIKQRKAVDDIINGRSVSKGSIKEYFDYYIQQLEKFRVKNTDYDKFEVIKLICDNLNVFTPYRDEFLSIISFISKYEPDDTNIKTIHKFFESSLYYLGNPSGVTPWWPYEAEIFKYIIYELFIYTLAILLKDENFKHLEYLLNEKYFIKEQNNLFGTDTLLSFTALGQHCDFISQIEEYKSKQTPASSFLNKRNKPSNIKFYYLMEADFVCYIKSLLLGEMWWPDTLIYLDYPHRAFELFAKSISPSYFNETKKIFGFESLGSMAELLQKLKDDKDLVPKWYRGGFDPAVLLGFDNLVIAGVK
jgi:hypothetical protein